MMGFDMHQPHRSSHYVYAGSLFEPVCAALGLPTKPRRSPSERQRADDGTHSVEFDGGYINATGPNPPSAFDAPDSRWRVTFDDYGVVQVCAAAPEHVKHAGTDYRNEHERRGEELVARRAAATA